MHTVSNYLLKRGSNAPSPNTQKVVLFKKATGFKFYFKFKKDCLYHFGDDRYDGDLNKLGGVSTNLSLSQNGARIGWNCGKKTMAELLADPWITLRGYVEKNNERVPTSNTTNDKLCRVRPEFWYMGSGNIRPMTTSELAYYSTIPKAGSYTHVVDINVDFATSLNIEEGLIGAQSTPINSDFVKGNQMITMPCPTPSSSGYYHFFPWFGGDAPGGSPHNMNIEMIHVYGENLLQRVSGRIYNIYLDVKRLINSSMEPEPGAA